MNRNLFMILLLVFLITICALEQTLVSNSLNAINALAFDLQTTVQGSVQINTPEVQAKVENLNSTWNYYENLLCYFSNHKDMKEMGIEIQRMIVYSATNQHEEFKASLALVILYSETFEHFMGISLQNIF